MDDLKEQLPDPDQSKKENHDANERRAEVIDEVLDHAASDTLEGDDE